MNPQMLIDDCSAAGVSVHLVGETLKLRGAAEAVKAVSELVRANKAALLAHLAGGHVIDLVAEFMEVDGMAREDTEAMAVISIQPRTPAIWLAMIAELDDLVNQYCIAVNAPESARNKMIEARNRQSLASIPASLDWFRNELALVNRCSSRSQA
jgi:hypothetical protein